MIACLVAALIAFPALAGGAAEAIESFGLAGTWATDCGAESSATRPSFRIIVAEPPGGAPMYISMTVDGGHKTTVRSIVQTAVPIPPRSLSLTLRIVGGDIDGGPLPSPTTNTFEHSFEKLPGDRLRMAGADPITLQRCPDQGR